MRGSNQSNVSVNKIKIDQSSAALSHKVQIEGYDILFPHQPYQIQVEFMSSLLKSLKSSKNCLLQSPTGTGKTLALLCASLAWLKKTRETEEVPSSRVIFATRTHSQIKQVLKELKNTPYRPTTGVLGSRDHFCVKKGFSDKRGHSLNIHCSRSRLEVEGESCVYYQNFTKMGLNIRSKLPEITDIEELKEEGSKQKFCPYYYSMKVCNECDLVLLPYNYLLETGVAKHLRLNLEKAVVIFDEGHNVENMAEEGLSFEISTKTLSVAIEELEVLRNVILNKPSSQEYPRSKLDDIMKLKRRIRSFFEFLYLKGNEVLKGSAREQGYLLEGSQIFEWLEEGTRFTQDNESCSGLNADNFEDYLVTLGRALDDLSTNFHSSTEIWSSLLETLYALLLKNIVIKNSIKETDNSSNSTNFDSEIFTKFPQLWEEDYINHYKGCLTYNTQNDEVIFSLWCLSPSMGFKRLFDAKARNVVITSGTLEPFYSFENELKLPFPIKLSNPHIIDSKLNLQAAVISTGPRGHRMNFSYKKRDDKLAMADLGELILSMCNHIPNGVLVFFASSQLLDACFRIWSSAEFGILKRLQNIKTVIREPRNSGEFIERLSLYEKNASSKGAILLAVCRGRFSEGIDFSDDLARAVMIVGVPFPPVMDKKVQLKKKHLDSIYYRKNRPESGPIVQPNFDDEIIDADMVSSSDSCLNGNDWYTLQAVRAMNQAVGRVIRHEHDFGAVYFLDERFQRGELHSNISKWVRDVIVYHEKPKTAISSCKEFFEIPRKKKYKIEIKKALEEIPIQPFFNNMQFNTSNPFTKKPAPRPNNMRIDSYFQKKDLRKVTKSMKIIPKSSSSSVGGPKDSFANKSGFQKSYPTQQKHVSPVISSNQSKSHTPSNSASKHPEFNAKKSPPNQNLNLGFESSSKKIKKTSGFKKPQQIMKSLKAEIERENLIKRKLDSETSKGDIIDFQISIECEKGRDEGKDSKSDFIEMEEIEFNDEMIEKIINERIPEKSMSPGKYIDEFEFSLLDSLIARADQDIKEAIEKKRVNSNIKYESESKELTQSDSGVLQPLERRLKFNNSSPIQKIVDNPTIFPKLANYFFQLNSSFLS